MLDDIEALWREFSKDKPFTIDRPEEQFTPEDANVPDAKPQQSNKEET